jgi:5-methylcytosine-specific restriction enzyme A
MEGALRPVVRSRYKRNPKLRQACVNHYGTACVVCDFSFAHVFGSIASGFIHVHHLTPISTAGVVRVNLIKDLRPVCPHCHAMLHFKDPPLAIEQHRAMVQDHARGSSRKP